ncbi:MAG: type II secretion system inner membrane protein GspF [Deltaproteobacteria bacterium]|nr:type II secretion system inner membrane protein GspF [Deltaproteobacteria bacterium]
MPVYEYKALDRAGKNKNGIIDADSPVAARQKLRGSGVFPVALKETSSAPTETARVRTSIYHFFKRIKPGELSAATRQLAILLGAGITLVSSLDALISQVPNPLLKKLLAQIKESVNEGNSLAVSLSRYPRVFSEIYINMVRAGEESGSLDLVLHRLAELTEHQQALRGRLKAALAYPVFMLFIGILVLFFLITFIVPNITKIFDEMHQILPLPTLILIGTSTFLKSFWWVVACGLGCAVLLIRRFIKAPKGRHLWDRLKLSAPLMGAVNTKTAMARFSRTLSSLLQNGVPLLSALGIVRNIVSNTLIAEVIDTAIDDIRSGKALAASLSKSRWFPPVVIQMISAGEQSGEIESMLNKIAEVYEGEVESQTLAMTSMLEPVMILFMGLTVGFIVISILLPIFEMNQMIR